MLELQDVRKSFRATPEGEVRAVDGISLSVGAGEFLAVQGPSGCGKSTLMLIAGGLLAPDQGTVLVDGEAPYRLGSDARARFRARHIGFVFQQFHLVPYLNVLDNVLAPSVATGNGAGAEAHAKELIERFGLLDRAHHVPAQLSTGERQRTALARALLNRPGLVLADEPTGNLDSSSADAVLGYLSEFARGGGAVLLVTHDERAAKVAQRIVHIRSGRLEEAGAPSGTPP